MKFELHNSARTLALPDTGAPGGATRRLVLHGQTIRLTWQGGGLAWHRPLAIDVLGPGAAQRLPIHDITRYACWASYLGGLALAVLAWLLVQRLRQGGSGKKRASRGGEGHD